MDDFENVLLAIEPNELHFPFEMKKQIPCSLQLRNRTDEWIAFKVKVNILKKYRVMPNCGILPPRSNCDVIVTMQAQKEAPPDMQCNDKFLVQSAVVMEGTTIKDITLETFKNEAGNVVNEVKMRAVYVQPPRPLSPVREGSEDGSSPRPSLSDGGDTNYQDATRESNEPPLFSDLGAHKEPEEITSEEASSLTEPSPSSRWQVYSDSKELLAVEPNELCFLFETNKRIVCSMRLTNITDDYIAYKVKNTSPKSYMVWPLKGVMPPRITCNIIVTREAQKEAPPNMQCKDKFLLLSAVVTEKTYVNHITDEMFKKDLGNVVNQVKLGVVLQPRRAPSPVREGSEERLSTCSSWSDGESTNYTGSTQHNMTLQHLKDITNNFSTEGILGKGGFGVVYKGVLGNGKTVAVKKLVQSLSSSQQQFENEVNFLMKLKHPNIVQLVGYCYETQHLHNIHEGKSIFAWNTECLLCLEYLPNGSLEKYISDPFSGLDWPTRYKIIEDISHGLQYLHEQEDGPIIHLDLKPANILLDENMIPKITDFGLSRLYDQKQTIHTAITSGTLGYMPPEYLRGIITPMSDIFSLGVIIMEVITGHRDYPYDIRTSSTSFIELELKKWRNVLQKGHEFWIEADCQQIKRCIQIGLLCVNPERTKRPTIKKIIDMLQGLESMNWYISNELSIHDHKVGP